MKVNIRKISFALFALLFVAVFMFADSAFAAGACDVAKFQESYTKHCFSCAAVSTIISVFLEVGADSYPLMQEAANVLLGMLSVLWIMLFLLKNLSSFSAVELPDFMQQLSIFFFKILVAAVCINGGMEVILHYTLEPIISFGTDFGIGFLSLTADPKSSSAEDYINLLQQLQNMEVRYV